MPRVTVRRKAISNGRHSLYLDFSPPVPIPSNGKVKRKEYLKVFIYDKPGSKLERLHNRETLNLVEFIRATRQLDIQNRHFGFISEKERNSNFIDFYRSIISRKTVSDSDNLAMSLRYFIAFAGENLRFSDITDFLCEDFRDYLLGGPGISSRDKPISRNTAASYFAKFRTVLKQAEIKSLISAELYEQIRPIKPRGTNRERLNMEELQQLVETPSKSDTMKRAALFSCLTGLRFVDIKALRSVDLKGSKGNYYLQFVQSKTENAAELPISDQAVELIPHSRSSNGLIFNELKYSRLKVFFVNWLRDAGISKNITFHNLRHTYATLQIEFGTDVLTLSKMLGHKSLKSTQVYAEVVDKKKSDASRRILLNMAKIK